ncbi:hypothetical protein EDB92DRAFT_1145425 [Lactarius akahatsu]|uniref:NACHT domain-containing protein n=1 Tax=Lactarius akahatsu TaxID=416441 RepID=A0AAD4LB69_9AGAM|nr:hypothetical protein EDB92DRAFT_1145425 [Lactarius akahatsu]
MSSSSQTSVSSSQFESIISAALNEFEQKTGKNLLDDWLAKELQNCESVNAVMDIIQGQAEAFDKFMNGGSKLMKWVRSSVHILYTISAALGDGVGVVVPSSKAVFTGIGILLAAAKDVRASHDALVDLFERIQFFLKRLGVHTRITPTKDMVEILMKIMAEVIGILSFATKEMQRSKTKMYLRKLLGRTDIEDALKKLDSLTQEEVRMAIAQVLQGINELKNDAKKTNGAMQQLAEKVDQIQWNQIEQDVRRWLSSPDPTVNYNTARKIYQEGTAVWFLEGGIFKEWDLIGSLLWIHGKPGSGKSILCASIIKHVISLRDAGSAALAYYYFDFRDEEKRNLRNFVTSLLTQLSDYSESCRNIILCLYFAHGKGTRQPDIDALIDCLKEIFKVVAPQPVYVIVDALDECPGMSGMPTPRETVLDLVEDLAHMQLPALHVCITSRPEVDIKEVLEPIAYCAVSLHCESGQQKDILDYVKAVVSSDRKMRKWRDEEKKLVVEELSKKVDGM